MTSTLVLLSLLTGESIQLAHSFLPGHPKTFAFEVSSLHGEVKGQATFEILPTGQATFPQPATVKLNHLTMEGKDLSLPVRNVVREYKLRRTGMPVAAKTNSVDELLVFAFAALYLPEQLTLDKPITIRWNTGKTEFRGFGRATQVGKNIRMRTQGDFKPEGESGYKSSTDSTFDTKGNLLTGSFKLLSPDGDITYVSIRPKPQL